MLLSNVEDPRTPWEKFRRTQMYRILKKENISCKPDAQISTMRSLAAENGLDPANYANFLNGGPLYGDLSSKQEIKVPKDEGFIGLKNEDEPMGYRETKRFAKSLGIKLERTDRIEDVQRKIGEHFGKDAT